MKLVQMNLIFKKRCDEILELPGLDDPVVINHSGKTANLTFQFITDNKADHLEQKIIF